MTNEELQNSEKVFIKQNNQKLDDLRVYASESYITNRRIGEKALIQCQHSFSDDLWIVLHKDETEGIYHKDELARITNE